MKEEWYDIKDYEGLYQVSNLGNVKSLEREVDCTATYSGKTTVKEKILKFRKDRDGYNIVCLYKEGTRKYCRVHRLVAEAFIPNPNNYPIVNHKDEIKDNNIYSNLEWCTVKYNNNYGTKNERSAANNIGKHNRRVRCVTTKKEFDSLKEAGEYYNCNLVSNMCKVAGTHKTCGKLPDGTPLHWEYID